MDRQFIAAARAWLSRATALPPRQRAALAGLVPRLLADLRGDGSVIGVAGPPGTGKSTLAQLLAAVLSETDTPCIVLSLDDYYLPIADRERLANAVHPLFRIRGVPGTHDLELLLRHVDGLLAGDIAGLRLPRFDKASDERSPEQRTYAGPPPRLVLLEGWCVGMPPPSTGSLAQDSNSLEHEQDPDQRWRHAVLQFAQRYDRTLNRRLARRWYLRAPDWSTIVDWRWQQEQELGARRRLDSPAAVAEFLATYERLCRHMQATCRDWADCVIELDQEHCPKS